MKYFLDIRLPDAIATDHDGIEFETAADAILAARAEAAGLVTDAIRSGETLLATAVLVRDASGQTITEVPIDWEDPSLN
jgi:hypothetical protein